MEKGVTNSGYFVQDFWMEQTWYSAHVANDGTMIKSRSQ